MKKVLSTIYHVKPANQGILVGAFLNNVQFIFINHQIIFYPKAVHLTTKIQTNVKILNKEFNASSKSNIGRYSSFKNIFYYMKITLRFFGIISCFLEKKYTEISIRV